jgi:outer membrane protein
MRTVAVAAVFLVLPAQARAESLREALAAAYLHHPSITSAVLAVQSAAESIAQRAAGTRPTIGISASVGASATTTIGGTTIPGAPNPSQTLSSSVGLNYSHRLFDNLSTDAAVGQAQALVEVARQALRNAEQNVLLQAATAYLNVVRDTRLVQLRQENVNFLQAQVRSSRDRLEIGEGTRIEVSQSEARLAQAVASFQSAVASLQISRASYARWVGHAPQNLSLDFRFVGILPPSLDEALRLGETQHPAILTAQAQIMAAQFGTDAARAAFGPTLDLIGSIGGAYSGTSALGTLPGAVSPTATASVRLSLSIPIYAGGAMGSAMRQANIGLAKSEFDALSTRDQIIEAVIAAWAGVQNASAQIESARTAVASGQLALDGVIEERDVGQSTTLAVLNARADLTTIQEGLISAQSSRLIAAFSLASATGTLSAADLQLPVETVSADGYVSTVQDIWQELRAVPE